MLLRLVTEGVPFAFTKLVLGRQDQLDWIAGDCTLQMEAEVLRLLLSAVAFITFTCPVSCPLSQAKLPGCSFFLSTSALAHCALCYHTSRCRRDSPGWARQNL
jgi:hypothetical protein